MTAKTRTTTAICAVALLVLAACTAQTPTPSTPSSGTTSSPAATAAPGDPATNDPEPVNSPAPTTTVAATLPFSWSESTLVETGWSQAPESRGDFFAGFAAPRDTSDALEFSVLDIYGTVRWRAERPATCTGYAVSVTNDGKPIVVLTDSDADTETAGRWQTTASAYDMATGLPVWGPVAVPGTVQGPGLVFGASAPAATLGAVGPRLALDPSTGRVIADEAATPGVRVVGEYHGVLLLAQDGALRAVDAGDGRTVWSAASPVGAATSSSVGAGPVPGAALLIGDNGGPTSLVDLADGAVIATGVDDAARDALSGTWFWTSGDTVHGSGADGTTWQRALPAAPSIAAAGTGFVYLRYGPTIHVLNAVTGRDAQAYPSDTDGRFAVPQAISEKAAAVFHLDGRELLAPVQFPPN